MVLCDKQPPVIQPIFTIIPDTVHDQKIFIKKGVYYTYTNMIVCVWRTPKKLVMMVSSDFGVSRLGREGDFPSWLYFILQFNFFVMCINYFLLNILKHYLWALSKSDILRGYGYEMVMRQWDMTKSVRFQVGVQKWGQIDSWEVV